MSANRQKRRIATKQHEPHWEALKALTDEEIAAQIAANPDAAPELDWSLDDPKVRIIVPTDVKAIRTRFGLSQEKFAKTFALNLATLRDWEQERRMPHGPARTLLQIIEREPEAVRRALAPKKTYVAKQRAAARPKTARPKTARPQPSAKKQPEAAGRAKQRAR